MGIYRMLRNGWKVLQDGTLDADGNDIQNAGSLSTEELRNNDYPNIDNFATKIYVDPDGGDDSDPGYSADSPVATLAEALNRLPQAAPTNPDDITVSILVEPGTTLTEAPEISYVPYRLEIDSADPSSTNPTWDLDGGQVNINRSNVKIDNIDIDDLYQGFNTLQVNYSSRLEIGSGCVVTSDAQDGVVKCRSSQVLNKGTIDGDGSVTKGLYSWGGSYVENEGTVRDCEIGLYAYRLSVVDHRTGANVEDCGTGLNAEQLSAIRVRSGSSQSGNTDFGKAVRMSWVLDPENDSTEYVLEDGGFGSFADGFARAAPYESGTITQEGADNSGGDNNWGQAETVSTRVSFDTEYNEPPEVFLTINKDQSVVNAYEYTVDVNNVTTDGFDIRFLQMAAEDRTGDSDAYAVNWWAVEGQ